MTNHSENRRDNQSWVIVLLALILLLQGILMVLYLSGRPAPPSPVTPAPAGPGARKPTPVALEVPVFITSDPVVQKVAGQLQESLATLPQRVPFVVALEDARVESATGIGEILVSARLVNEAPLPVAWALCRIQLRDARHQLVYQATSEVSLPGQQRWLPGDSARVRFLIDNPPEFEQVHLMVEQVEFGVEGY